MITVYVWQYRGKGEAWGHASMLVETQGIRPTYVSWWPSAPGQVPSGIHANLYASYPLRNRTFAEDVAAEQQHPDQSIALRGLDEAAVIAWWSSFGLVYDGQDLHGPPLAWETLNRNCSTVVATGLRMAGADDYASWSKSWNLVWTPNDVLQYARSIQQGLLAGTRK